MKNNKNIIVGAGLGGLITGILLKMTRPDDEVIIYESNNTPGGFCSAFEKISTYNDEKIKYTFNVPVTTPDFGLGEPFDLFLKYLGVKNLNWRTVKKPFQFYPLNDEPFLFTKETGVEDIIKRTPDEEKKCAQKFFDSMKNFYLEVFHKSYMNPNFFESLKMLFTMPKTVFIMLQNKTYGKYVKDVGIKTKIIQDIFGVTEGFMGVEAERASAVGQMLMLQSFLENSLMQPTDGDTFQTLSNRLAERFKELGGKLYLKTTVDHITFTEKKCSGVFINNNHEPADNVFLSVAQDRIKDLISKGKNINKIKKLLNKIDKITFPNSDFYSLYLLDKSVIEKHKKLTDIAYHVYKKNCGLGGDDWNLFMFIPHTLYNEKYYVMILTYIERDQKIIDEWIDLRNTDYKKYNEKKDLIAEALLKDLQDVEPIFKENPPLKYLLSISPASYLQYGSKYPISGLGQTSDNFGISRMKQVVLDNLFISGGASFSAGVWGAIAGGWMGFVESYKKITGIKIGNKDIIYKPGLKNLP
ncbi:MAG: hypothetical protein KA885_07920 [Spirochaetes bacterium]|nr:hypothetical protein [Spirochaetota bacterium]